MKNTIYIGLLAAAVAAVSGCRLDGNLFNPNDTPITEYTLDAYTGQRNPDLDASYDIPDSLIHLFTTTSDIDGNQATIYGVYIGDTNNIAVDTVILYCHGNRDHIDHYWNRAKLLAHVGGKNRFGVLIFDYRGYGISEGEPSEAALYADTEAMMKWLKNHGLSNDRFIMYGYSMGTAPATQLTATPKILTPKKLILESPFASAEVMVQQSAVINIPASFVVDLEIDNAEEIKKVTQPFLIIHGKDDDFLDFEQQGLVVAKNYQGCCKTEAFIEAANHSDIPAVMGLNNYLDLLETFILE